MSSQADALNHVFDVLSFDQETKDFLIAKRLTTVRKLVNHSQATYQAYCDEAGSKLSLGHDCRTGVRSRTGGAHPNCLQGALWTQDEHGSLA